MTDIQIKQARSLNQDDQFNLAGRIYTITDVQTLVSDDHAVVLVVAVDVENAKSKVELRLMPLTELACQPANDYW